MQALCYYRSALARQKSSFALAAVKLDSSGEESLPFNVLDSDDDNGKHSLTGIENSLKHI